ncbi:hypothetical protein PLESTB_000985800 [Pleodorina starrii]|uniref:Mitochondrial ribonuclease P catalytic subunit n=1 Tax=Pleodorina starrii TaxID=330485 RepID=A0A9W6F417_9CHLO|nr:hypothetical protein PLESTM_000548300 [Pleodorina starrii]GLC55424.1 hypothetical protein PLESTB_000985800 [Pleodorina starrii]GLC73817.1 hypothetical protein PLESTF_001424200 [Pleodorina starrii]
MLLSRRVAALAHATFARHLPLRSWFIRSHISERASACRRFPPPACTAPVAGQDDSAALDDILDFGMGEESEQGQEAPLAKRQRTGDGPAAHGAGDAGAAGAQPNGAQQNQGNQKGQGAGAQRKGRKDPRIPAMQQAVKVNNLKHAMKLFGELVAEGGSLQTPIINSLMYLACGAEQWERYVRGLPLLSLAEAAPAALAVAATGARAGAATGEGGDGGGGGEAEMAEAQEATQQQQQQRKGKPAKPLTPLPEGPPPPREELLAAMDELWSYMGTAGLQPDQATYLALARLEALKGNAQASLQWAVECGKMGKPVQLRLFHPAQVCYCMSSDVAQLHHIDDLIASHRLDNTEYEYARLLEGIAAAGTYAQLRAVLVRMQADLNELSPATADFIAAFFERSAAAAQQAFAPVEQGGCPGLAGLAAHISAACDGGAAAAAAAPTAADGADTEANGAGTEAAAGEGAGGGWRWRVLRGVSVAEDGQCQAAGGSLKVIDLEDKDWEAFATAIGELARKNMGQRSGDFDTFVQWYDRNGPYDILVDAANVAFFGQNFEGGGFNWRQVQDMVELLKTRFEGKKILVMVHRKRVNDQEARAPHVQSFLEKLRRTKSFYNTPPGANDDWFWLYACVRSKHNGLLVSNDELRDHIFSLLRPKHFLKWKQRHIAHYAFAYPQGAAPPGGPGPGKLFALQMPHPYTACVQQLAESGAWMVPIAGVAWLAVKPERAG